jgi:tetratricopeptide (TPR) repeat protein
MSKVTCKQFARGLWVSFFWAAGFLVVLPSRAAEPPPALAEVAVQRGEYPLAAQWRLEEAQRSGNIEDFSAAARLAYDWSQYTILAAIADAWLRRDPHSEGAHRFLAVAALELDRRAIALRELDWLLKQSYTNTDAGFQSLGRSFSELRNHAGVAAVMRSLVARYPQSAEGHLQLGNLALAAGDAVTAHQEAQKAHDLGLTRLGRMLAARAQVVIGDCQTGLDLAAPLATEVRDIDRLTEAWLMVVCDRGAEGELILQDLAQRSDQKAAALEALAGRELDTHRNELAGRHYMELAKAGDRESAQFGLAALAERMGETARAVVMYAVITTGRHAVDAQLRAYRIHIETDGLNFADRVLDEFLFGNPSQRRDVTVGRMLVLADHDAAEAALALAQRVERAYPDAEEVIRAEAEVLVRTGRIDEAIRRLEHLLDRRPDDPAAQNALGYTLADAGRDLRRADRLLTAACAQAPNNSAYLDSYGWLRFRQHRYQDAAKALAQAYRLQPDPEIAAHYVEALFAADASDAAMQVLAAALQRSPEEAHLLRVQSAHAQAEH